MLPGTFYHVYNRGNNKEDIFLSPENYNFFLQRFHRYLGKKVNLHAYCLMPNHFHLLVEVLPWENYYFTAGTPVHRGLRNPVIRGFRNLFISYAKAFNKQQERTGSLFQSKFKRKQIDSEAYFGTVMAYIHTNPVIAGLTSRPEDWPYQSYRAYLTDGPSWHPKTYGLQWFGGKQAFRDFHQQYLKTKENLPEGAWRHQNSLSPLQHMQTPSKFLTQ